MEKGKKYARKCRYFRSGKTEEMYKEMEICLI